MSKLEVLRFRGLAQIKDRIERLTDELDGAVEIQDVLHRAQRKPPQIVQYGDQWMVDIPPLLPEHFEGDNILAPFGGIYFDTLEEATAFMARTLAAIEEGEDDQDA